MKAQSDMKLLICGHDYNIVLVDNFKDFGETRDLLGLALFSQRVIALRSDLRVDQLEETLIHEIGHCILYHCGHHNSLTVRREDLLDAFGSGFSLLGVGEFLLKKAKREGKKHG